MTDKVQNSSLFYEKYQIESQIGRGASGVCYKIKRISDSRIFALKKISSSSIKVTPSNNCKKNNMKAAYNQVSILSSLQHPNIIKYYESFMDDQDLYIIMQYAQKGDLHSILKKRKIKQYHFEQQEIWAMIEQLLNGLEYLHSKNIIHRDVKTLNIFVEDSNKVIIGDLGVSKIVKSDLGLYSRVGTPLYLPPEIIKYEKYDFKADVWGLGCVSYLLATLNHPFQGKNIISLGQNIVGKDPKPIEKYSSNLQSLILEMLEKNHIKRMSPSMLLKKYFSDNQKIKKVEKVQLKKTIQNCLIEANIEKQTHDKKLFQKSGQRRYLTSAKPITGVQNIVQHKQIEAKGIQNYRNDKKFRYMIGNFVNEVENHKKQKSDIPVSSYKTFQNTIAIKPNKILKEEEEQFINGNEEITKIQKQTNNQMKKFILSSQNLKKKDQLSFWKTNGSSQKFDDISQVGRKIETKVENKIQDKIEAKVPRKGDAFKSSKQKNAVQSAQCFRPFCENQLQDRFIYGGNQIYTEKKANLIIRKMPTQTKYAADTQNLRNNKQNSVGEISQPKNFTRNMNTSVEMKDKAKFLDILRVANEAGFDTGTTQTIPKNRYRQRPKSSIGKKEHRYSQNSCMKPKKKQNLYSNFYSIVETKVLKKPQVIIL